MQSFVKPIAGAPVPDLAFDTVAHGRVAFSRLDGWRMLVIYRGRHCPLCRKYLDQLQSMLGDFTGLGVAVHAWSADSAERARGQVAEQEWTFPVGVELDIEQMRQLGFYISSPLSPDETDRPFAEPALIVVNPEHRMQIVAISNSPHARPELRAVCDGIDTIQRKHYPIRGTG